MKPLQAYPEGRVMNIAGGSRWTRIMKRTGRLPVYWNFGDMLNDVRNAEGLFEDVNVEIMQWKETFGR